MSHPVFLTHSAFAHMPSGSQNEWSTFFQHASFELQADSFIPILWLMLFRAEDLKWASYTDLIDHDHPDLQAELEAYKHEFDDHEYAYLVTSQSAALTNLEQQREFFTRTFGEEYLSFFEHFKTTLRQHYSDYVLLRSSGLATAFDDAEHLTLPLEQMAMFDATATEQPPFQAYLKTALIDFDDPAYFFYGIAPSIESSSEILVEDHTADLTSAKAEVIEPSASQTLTTPTANSSGTLIAICTAIVAILTLGVWYLTQSVLNSVVVFIVSAFILGFISSLMGKPKIEKPSS